jgi:DNA-binding transcriptional LysR family regulator
MAAPDLNLLVTLDVLLAEGSVAAAARRLRLSPSAMSRALARLRAATGDPLLVRAGRGLVPTPRAAELREDVARLVEEAQGVLRPTTALDLAGLHRTFTLRVSEGFVESFGPALLGRITAEAPGVRLRFVAKTDKGGTGLRDGSIDLETGVAGRESSPETIAKLLFRDRLVGAARPDHPLAQGEISPARYAQASHVLVSRRSQAPAPVDEALERLGLQRHIATTVSGFGVALALARATGLVATVPDRHTLALRGGMRSFALPFATAEIPVSLMWHPRSHADPAHRWLRECVSQVCGAPEDHSSRQARRRVA